MRKQLLIMLSCIFFAANIHAQVYLSEDFSTATGATPPTGWTQNTITGTAGTDVWRFDNPGARALNAPITGPAAIFDSDNYSNGGGAEDVALESPAFSTVGQSTVILTFDHYFQGGFGGAFAVEVYNGTSWVSVLSGTVSTANPQFESVNISAQAAGIANAQVRFRWTGDFSWYWILDNVTVFTPAAGDLGVISMTGPDPDCGLSASEVLSVEIQNFGSASQSTFDVAYTLNGGTPVVEAYTGPAIAPGDTGTYTFTTTADLSLDGVYDFQGYTILTGDIINTNDTTDFSTENFTAFPVPYLENFDSFTTGTSGVLANGWYNDGDNDWYADAGGTPSSGTGPSADHTLGTSAGVYLFTETSGPATGAEFVVKSPCIDMPASGIYNLSYWYHMYGVNMGDLEVYVISNGVRTKVDSISGQQQLSNAAEWKQRLVDMTPYLGQTVVLEFKGIRGAGFESDMAIDDVSIDTPPANDVALTNVSGYSEAGCSFTPGTFFTVDVENLGTASQPSIDVGFIVNGGTAFIETILPNPALPYGSSTSYTFSVFGADFSLPGTYDVKVFTGLPTDANVANDTMYFTIENLGANTGTFPYLETFDSFTVGTSGNLSNGWSNVGDLDWYADDNGTPSTSTGPSGDNTTGTGVYLFTETSSGSAGQAFITRSPCVDLPVSPQLRLSYFYHMYGATMGSLETYINVGGVYTRVDSIGGQQQTSSAEPFQESVIDISAFGGNSVFIEFRGTHGGGITGDMAIDDVSMYIQSSVDVAFNKLLSPAGADTSGCFGGNETIVFEIENNGLDTIDFAVDTLDITLASTGANTGVYTAQLNAGMFLPGQLDTITFTNVDVSLTGITSFIARLDLDTDGEATNDTLRFNLDNLVPATYPYSEDFDGFTVGNPGTFLNGWTNKSTPTGPYDWRVNTGGTSSTDTGPIGDNTTGSGNYLYTEASSPRVLGDQFVLSSPCIDLSGSIEPVLSYYYHMYGADMGRLDVYVISNGIRTHVDSIIGQQQLDNPDPYEQSLVSLTAFSGIIELEFVGTNGDGFNSDIAIDDILIDEAPATDLSIAEVSSPAAPEGFGCLGGNETVNVSLSNIGSGIDFASDSTLIEMFGTGANTFSDSLWLTSGTLPLAGVEAFGFTGINLATPGITDIRVIVSTAADTNAMNDTLDITFETQPVVFTYPYLENFETGPNGWIVRGNNSSWAFGTPAKTVITGAASGDSAWVTGGLGTTVYNPSENSAVYSPCFDMTNAPMGANVAMQIWVESETGWDGTVLQSSVDSGRTWQNVGNLGDPFNWYNDGAIDGNPGGQSIGWSGYNGSGSPGWVTAFHPLDSSLIGMADVRFRVAFGSDGSVQDDGFAFDDFAIALPPVVDLGPDSAFYCINDSLDAGNPGNVYLWSNGDTTQRVAITNLTGAPIIDSTIVAGVLNPYGMFALDTLVFSVYAETPPTVTALNVTDVACFGDSTGSISIDVAGGANPFGFIWDNGDTTEDLTGLPAGTYIGTISDTNGCSFVSPAITIAQPAAAVSVMLDSIGENDCPDDEIGSIDITVMGGTPPYSFSWSNGDTTEDLSGLAVGTYIGTITDSNGCELISPALDVTSTDSFPATPVITVEDNFGSNYFFSTDTTGVLSYTWDFGDGSSPVNGTNVNHIYTTNGTYEVILTVVNECGPTSDTLSLNVSNVGLEDMLKDAISLYPNPTSGQFGLSFENLDVHDVAVKVTNMEGQTILSENLGNRSGSFTHQVNLPAGTARGVYMVQIRVDEVVVYKRVQLK